MDQQEQIARINHLLATTSQALMDIDKTKQEMQLAPIQLIVATVAATTAIIGAGAALAKLFGA